MRREGRLIPSPTVLTAISDGAMILAHGRKAPPTGLSVHVDGAYVGPVEARVDPGLPGAGLKAVNQIADPEFREADPPWTLLHGHEDVAFGVGFSEKWSLSDGAAAYIHLHTASAVEEARLIYRDPVQGDRIVVTPGATYAFGAYLGQHRCEAWLTVSFFDEDGETLTEVIAQPTEARRRRRQSTVRAGSSA